MDLIAALRVFVRVNETGSFSAAAREAHVSQSAVTRLVEHLEQHFEARLIHRTTRRLSLTEDGQSLLAHAQHLLESAEEMEAALGQQNGAPRGLVRLGTSVAGGLFLATRLPELLARHPGLSVELVMRDRPGDMIEERLDVSLRVGEIADSSLVARRIGYLGRAVVAAPVYLERHGAPATPEDLADHVCLIHDSMAEPNVWRFTSPRGPLSIEVKGCFIANDSEAVRRATQAGYGIALLSEIQVIDDVRAGRLFRLLGDYQTQRLPLHIVYSSRRNLALRTRVVMEFLAEQTRVIAALLDQAEVLTLGRDIHGDDRAGPPRALHTAATGVDPLERSSAVACTCRDA
jgi:DNA-binding transcriptional LysR family regulator